MKTLNVYLLIIANLFLFSAEGMCIESYNSKRHLLVGVNGGLGQQPTFTGDIYGGYMIQIGSNIGEANVGYSYFKNKTDFDGVDDLWYRSHGLFGEFNYYFKPRFFTGARVSINMNFVDKESQNNYSQYSTKDPPLIFPGLAVWGHLGYDQKILKNIYFRLNGKLGLHNYQIQTGAVYFSNDTSPIPAQFQDRYAKEMQLKFLCDISVGIIVKL